MSDMTVEKAQALLDGARQPLDDLSRNPPRKGQHDLRDAAPDLARAYIAQAAALDAREAELSKLKDVLAKINPNEIVQAAELTRLRARIEAVDRLAEAADAHLDALNDYLKMKNIGCGDTGAAKAMASLVAESVLRAALSAYEEAGK